MERAPNKVRWRHAHKARNDPAMNKRDLILMAAAAACLALVLVALIRGPG
jgi:hypothetical protein